MAGQQSGSYADTWDFDPGDKNPDNASPEEQRQARNPWSNADPSKDWELAGQQNPGATGYSEGNVYDPGAWGGVSGAVVNGQYDPNATGRRADVDRYRNMAEAARNRTGPQINYGVADLWGGRAGEMRSEQDAGISLARDRALGINSQAQKLGQSMIEGGIGAQRSVAASARGGPLSVASAMGAQQADEAGFRAGANARLAAVMAREQAQGRGQFLGAGLGQRAGDLTSQGLNQQQGIAQGEMDRGQRELNLQGEMEYESQGAQVNKQSAAGALDRLASSVGSSRRDDQNQAARAAADRADATGAAKAGAAAYQWTKMGASSGGGGSGQRPQDNYSDPRTKRLADFY